MADIHGSPADVPQNPQNMSPGSAPVPYAGTDQSPEPPVYGPGLVLGDAAAEVMNGIPGMASVAESPVAHDIAAGTADAPYYPGPLSPIDAMGDADAGGRDDVAGSVAEAVANATARWHEYQGDATVAGPSQIGDAVTLPPVDSNAAVGVQGPFTDQQPPSGSFT